MRLDTMRLRHSLYGAIFADYMEFILAIKHGVNESSQDWMEIALELK